jgi:large subunit ribosomal protein L5
LIAKNIVFVKNVEQKINNMVTISIKEKYKNKVIPGMEEKFSYGNVMSVPKIEKVIINSGFGKLVTNKTRDEQKKFVQYVEDNVQAICGQKPVMAPARKSISTFKLREGNIIGVKVTLRGKKMYDFIEKLVNITLPRSRDFQGIKLTSVDNNGNLNLGIREHIVFPEILPEKSPIILGMEVTIVTSAKSREEGLELFKLLDFPFKKS